MFDAENTIKLFADQYYEKIFYFSLKKTGNRTEAEDLTSDIILDIISALRKGTIPEYFSAYVWKVARSRFCKWAEKRINSRKYLDANNFDELDLRDAKRTSFVYSDVEDGYIHKEDINNLRREISLISKEYREILVSFYIDDKKISQIAKEFNLPEGTVKTKLYKSRKILTEGMKMAREFGIKSYKPEDVHFTASGNQPSGLPWKLVQRNVPKNILLQAHNNPSTIEELSLELGIAAPYMEEEVQLLVDGELLAETDGKYVTNFFIADKECQVEIYNTQRKNSKDRSAVIDEIVEDSLPAIRELGIAGDSVSDNELKWLIVTRAADLLMTSKIEFVGFKRKDGGNWGFTGYEQNNLIAEERNTWHNGNIGGGSEKTVEFWRYSYPAQNIGTSCSCLGYNHSFLFEDIVKNKRNINSFTEPEKKLWKDMNGWYAHADEDGNVIFDVPVFKSGDGDKLNKIIKSHAKTEKLDNDIIALFNEVKNILTKYSNPVIKDNINYYVGSFMWAIRTMVINDEVEAKRLLVPEVADGETVKCNIGLYVNM